jgi:hypothetical protein
MRGTLPRDVVGEIDIGCLLQPMAGRHLSVTLRNGQAMAGSSLPGGNVPPYIQIGIDTPA